ncbi:peptidyl-prolyl cis-trans isomerase A [Bacterioplanes sanyensis]|uniref:peptidylprolyl isomerase n=1 Tax=Bacterioplanes sanyensis TaxID=1249553 RepID=UPI00167985A1|nr:peptidylprolyl isomerase [Bacterioplanes sanyensis]GGY32171.1 peptidyl-prolyl cis-trans isomerase A [Bacterioplanes sanyensis]
MRQYIASALLLTAAMVNAENTPVVVELQTTAGNIVLELDREKAPISVENFLTYVEADHYDGTIFHRVIADFMVQGGGYDEKMSKKATLPPIKNEADNGLTNVRGSVAMARTAVVDSATSQFFINVKNNDFLNHGVRDFGYAVFGKVTAGMEVVDSIAATTTGMRDQPVENIVIKDVIVKGAAE